MTKRVDALVCDLRLPEQLPDEPAASLSVEMTRSAIPGVGLAIVADGRIDWAGGFGVRESRLADPVADETLFQAGSISKPVAALCGLRLVELGAIDLDVDVNDALRSWRIPPNGDWQPRVTLRQLLSHTAGLTVHGFPGYPLGGPTPSLIDVLEGRGNTQPVRVRTMPGLQFSYSGGGYTVLQQLVIDLTGRPFADVARELVLEPLGMEESTYEQPLPEAWRSRAATGHRTAGIPVQGRWHVYPELAAAGLWTTPRDLARFVIGVQRAQDGAPDAILSRQIVDELLSPQAPNVSIGLGLLLEGEGRSRLFRHGGDDQGFVAMMVGSVECGFGAVAMTNADQGLGVLEALLDAVARAYDWPDPTGFRDAEPRNEPEAVVGQYESADGSSFSVEARAESLLLRVSGQPPVELVRSASGEWRTLPVLATIRFDVVAGRMVLSQQAEYVRDIEACRV